MSDIAFGFDNSYARLPERFFARLDPTPVRAPRLLKLNHELAAELGLDADALDGPLGAEIFSGNRAPADATPIAQAYAGHQFGGWSPQLGDGRAILLGEIVDAAGRRRDVQLKGSGRTPWSRMGDGRAPLGPVIREYLVSEAMAALGVPTSRSLAVVATGEPVLRETPLPGGVLARVATSHIRVGTFQYFAARDDVDALRDLADHAIRRHDPDAAEADNPPLALLSGVIARQARLVAQWMSLGFVHGVMNTDNMTVSGETIDYGPCAFLEAYDPATVFSSIDAYGRYAYGAQPGIAQWNLARLAQALLPILAETPERAIEQAQAAIDAYPEIYRAEWLGAFGRKLGLERARPEDAALIEGVLNAMATARADFTESFRKLSAVLTGEAAPDPAIADWVPAWRARLAEEGAAAESLTARLDRANPAVIPRNHRVEEAIAAAYAGDLEPFERLSAALKRPFDPDPEDADLAAPAAPDERILHTFCGT
ncbi:MAG: YdiU family protein [Pseudomonadota bacterium]